MPGRHESRSTTDVEWGVIGVLPISETVPAFAGPEVPAALLALNRAHAMGIVDELDDARPLLKQVVELLDAVEGQRFGGLLVSRLRPALSDPARDPRQVARWLADLHEVMADNPVPKAEVKGLLRVFEEDQLSRLLAISRSSVRRYLGGERSMPTAVEDRLHWLALAVGYLLGTYNEWGIRRWFDRPRALLDGRSPSDVLLEGGAWTPEDQGPTTVLALARSTIGTMGMPAT